LTVLQDQLEDSFIVPTIEPEYNLIGVRLKVLWRHSVINVDHRPLEQRPKIAGYCMYIAVHKGLGVSNCPVYIRPSRCFMAP